MAGGQEVREEEGQGVRAEKGQEVRGEESNLALAVLLALRLADVELLLHEVRVVEGLAGGGGVLGLLEVDEGVAHVELHGSDLTVLGEELLDL
jgi:hypothetical protein